MRRYFRVAAVAAAVLIALGTGAYQLMNARCFAIGMPAICRVETERPRVALSFDDGPTARGIDAVLPELERRGARATFFLTGSVTEARPELARRVLAAGHEIANHSYTHPRMVFHSRAFYDREIAQTQAVLKSVGGSSDLFRPPYGKKLFGLPAALKQQNLRMVMWDVEEPRTDDPAVFARRVVDAARSGSIILLHVMYAPNEPARRALPAILDGLAAKGLEVVSVSELLRDERRPSIPAR